MTTDPYWDVEFDSPGQITRLIIRNDVGGLTNAEVILYDKDDQVVGNYQIVNDVQPIIACSSSSGNCNSYELMPIQFDDLHDVKCCADEPSASDTFWSQTNPQCPFKLKFKGSNSINTCPGMLTYAEAEAFCESYSGGRLCTQAELDNDCAEGVGICPGVNLDDELIWSSTKFPITILETDFVYTNPPTYTGGFVIDDAADEEQCSFARIDLGFDADEPNDIEVCEQFNAEMCDEESFFAVVDEILEDAAPPRTSTTVGYRKRR